MNKKKIKQISHVLSIFKTLNKEDLHFFCINSSKETVQIFLEVVFNLITNQKLFERVEDKELLERVRDVMRKNKKQWCSMVKSTNDKTKLNFLRRQIGSGVLENIASIVLPIILALL